MEKKNTESKWNKNESIQNKNEPLKVHRMNWKFWIWGLTGWRPKNDEERWRTSTESLTETYQKRYRSTSALIFSFFLFLSLILSETQCKKITGPFYSAPSSLFIGENGRWLPSSSPRQAGLLPPEATPFLQNTLRVRKWARLLFTPPFC